MVDLLLNHLYEEAELAFETAVALLHYNPMIEVAMTDVWSELTKLDGDFLGSSNSCFMSVPVSLPNQQQ